MENLGQETITLPSMVQEAKNSYLLIPKSHLTYFNHVSIIPH